MLEKVKLDSKCIKLSLLILPVILILINNSIGYLYNCFNAQDFGIYQQGIWEFSWSDLNPYRTIRDLKVFNDHVNPIIYLAAPIAWISNYHGISLIVLEWFSFLIGLFLIAKWSEQRQIVWLLTCAIFTKGLLSGLEFPIHPGVWSFPVWIWWVRSIFKDKTKAILLSSFILCLFRESYPFAILMLSFSFFIRKKHKPAIGTFVISIFFLLFIFIFRPYLLGEVKGYGSSLFSGFSQSPLTYVFDIIAEFDYMVVFKLFYPFSIPFYFIIRSREHRSELFSVLMAISPLIAMHFLANSFYFQYPVAFVAPALGIMIFTQVYNSLNRGLLIMTAVLFIASSSSIYTKMFKRVALEKDPKCHINKSKKENTVSLLKLTAKIPIEAKILSTSGVIQRILKPGMKIYQIRQFSKPQIFYDYLLLERNYSGDISPLNPEDVIKIEEKCLSYGKRIIDNKDYLLVKGKFPTECAL